MVANSSEVEQVVARTLRDSLAKLQQTTGELDQAIGDLVSACASSRPSNSLPPMLRARSAAASLAASLEVLSKFVMVALQTAAEPEASASAVGPAATAELLSVDSPVTAAQISARVSAFEPTPIPDIAPAESMELAAPVEFASRGEPPASEFAVSDSLPEAAPPIEAPPNQPEAAPAVPAEAQAQAAELYELATWQEPSSAVEPEAEPEPAPEPASAAQATEPFERTVEPVSEPAKTPEPEAEPEPASAGELSAASGAPGAVSEPVTAPEPEPPAEIEPQSVQGAAEVVSPVPSEPPAAEDLAPAVDLAGAASDASEPIPASTYIEVPLNNGALSGEEVALELLAFDVLTLAPEQQELHRRANRVAKVSMQDVKMLRPQEVALGREHKDICIRLRDDIEKAHREYDRRFQAIKDHPVDYFYDWMVQILGDGNPETLGEYPYRSPALRR